MGTAFDMRLVAYTPLGARIGVLPDNGFNVTATASGPALSANISTQNLGQLTGLPTDLEVAVEVWRDDAGGWRESRDSRFACTLQQFDDRDLSGTVALTGVGLAAWLLQAAIVAPVAPYSNTSGASEAAKSATISVNGTVLTWSGNPIGNGDRIRVKNKGNAKNVVNGGIYFAVDLSGNNFSLLVGENGSTRLNLGKASNLQVERIVTRIVGMTGHKFAKSQAVKTTGGDAVGLSDDARYYVVNPTASTIQLSDKPGGTPVEMNTASKSITSIYRDIDGERIFDNAGPGRIMSTLFYEARDRGWSQNPQASGQGLNIGFTGSADSLGQAWASMADDPDTPGISISWQPGTPLAQVLSFMLEREYAEWYSSGGRTIHMVNAGTGVDRTTGATPVRIGSTASQIPTTVDISGMRNAISVRGTEQILQTATGTIGPWGRLESYETSTGSTTNTLAAEQARTDLAKNGTGQVGYQVTENAQEAPYLPLVHYSRGDWVAAQVPLTSGRITTGGGWTRLRVTEWQYAKASNGVITVTTTLEYRKRTTTAKAVVATITQAAGISDGGTASSPIPAGNARKPAFPLGVTVTQAPVFARDGSANSVFTVSWLPVTADLLGGTISASLYEVWVRDAGAARPVVRGSTSGTSVPLPPFPSGGIYQVQVRAQTQAGQWGELSPELEVTASFPATVPNPPTAPSVSSKLGQVRVAWDGNLLDPEGGTQTPTDGFAYVSAAYCATVDGTYTPVGLNMGNAGFTVVSGLTVGSSYYFALFAANTVGTTSQMSPAVQFTVVGVTGPDIVANSVTANSIAAGAITADKIALGAVPTSNPINRVPQPPFVTAFWSKVVDGSAPGYWYRGAYSSADGLFLPPGNNNGGTRQSLMVPTAVPPSGKVMFSIGGNPNTYAREYDAYGNYIREVSLNYSSTYVPSDDARLYEVFVANFGSGTTQVQTASIFEVIGNGGGQSAELSPQGLRLFDSFGNLAVDLTTATQQYLSVLDNSGGNSATVASVDLLGNAQFTQVSVDGLDVDGYQMVSTLADSDWPVSIAQSNTSDGRAWQRDTVQDANGSPVPVPLLDRLGRGVIYDVTWTSVDTLNVAAGTTYQRIAADSFTLEANRFYMLVCQFGNIQINNSSGYNVYLELQISMSPMTQVSDGYGIARSVIYGNPASAGNLSMNPVVFGASSVVTSPDYDNRLFPAGVPIYWQLNTRVSTNTKGYVLSEQGNTRGLSVIDVGNIYATRHSSGYSKPTDVSDRTVNASQVQTQPSSKPVTKTYACTWSASYDTNGTRMLTSSTPNNARLLYQGNMGGYGSSAGIFGFGNLGLSGRTITNMQVYLRNVNFSGKSNTARFGTSAASSAPGSVTSRANAWDVSYKDGDAKWVTVPKNLWSQFASGQLNSFTVGYSSASSDLAYFEGYKAAGGTKPPLLKVTYQ